MIEVLTLNVFSGAPSWKERSGKILEHLKEKNYDFVALQEIQKTHADFFKAVQGHTNLKLVAEDSEINKTNGFEVGNCILVDKKYKKISTQKHDLDPGQGAPKINPGRLLIVETEDGCGGDKILISTTHLAWGGQYESTRLEQVRQINNILKSKEAALKILSGDFNCTPNSASVRFLTGLGLDGRGESTYYTDVWELNEADRGYTVCRENPVTFETAKYVDTIKPDLVPGRREDYIFIEGWVWGKQYGPVSSSLVGVGQGYSDHYGVQALLYVN